MIEANSVSLDALRRAYDFRSSVYDKTVAVSELKYHQQALDKISWESSMRVLEVATGPGRVLLEIAQRIGTREPIYGIDLSLRMLDLAQKRASRSGFKNIVLRQGDCRQLPWKDDYFDVLYNGYMMDLIPISDIARVLDEMYRVLKPGGNLIMVNMSKPEEASFSLLERLYQLMPKSVVLHIMGNCRPVLMQEPISKAGFSDIEREYVSGKHPTEIITATK